MKSLTYDELKILFDNRKKDFDNNNKKGERKMSEKLNIKPGDSFVLFFADEPKTNEKAPDFKRYLNEKDGNKLPIVGWTNEKNGKQYISGVVNETYKKED